MACSSSGVYRRTRQGISSDSATRLGTGMPVKAWTTSSFPSFSISAPSARLQLTSAVSCSSSASDATATRADRSLVDP